MPATYDDVATLVQARQLADQIVRDLEATKSRPIPYVGGDSTPPPPPAIEPEELLPPPPSLPPSNIYETSWSTTLPIAGAPLVLKNQANARTLKRPQRKRKATSRLHWAVLAMSIAIAFGLWRDPLARANAKRQLATETHRVAKTVFAKAGALKASATTTAKRVSARII